MCASTLETLCIPSVGSNGYFAKQYDMHSLLCVFIGSYIQAFLLDPGSLPLLEKKYSFAPPANPVGDSLKLLKLTSQGVQKCL